MNGHAAELGLHRRVVVEPEGSGQHPPPLSGVAGKDDRIEIGAARDRNSLVIDVTLAGPAMVVLADTYVPRMGGWVDGDPAPIFRAVGRAEVLCVGFAIQPPA